MKRVLLADDHSFIRLGIMQILKDEYPSVEIKEVSDGDELIKEVMKQDWDLVISDLDMPGRNGLEALESIALGRFTMRPGAMSSQSLSNSLTKAVLDRACGSRGAERRERFSGNVIGSIGRA